MKVTSTCLILVVLLASEGRAVDVYVNNLSGNDQSDGRQPRADSGNHGPLKTIARALSIAERSDRIILADTGAPYRESITLSGIGNSGYRGDPFVIEGNGAILDGTRPIPAGGWRHFRGPIYRFRPSRLSYQLLFRDGKPLDERKLAPGSQALPKLEPLEWCLRDGFIYFRVEKDKTPAAYALAHTSLRVGITLYRVRHVAIANLIVQGFQLDGVNAHDDTGDTTLAGLTSRGNARAGIVVAGSSRVRIDSCLVGDNGRAQIRVEGPSFADVVECDILENPAPAYVVRGGGRLSVDGKLFRREAVKKPAAR